MKILLVYVEGQPGCKAVSCPEFKEYPPLPAQCVARIGDRTLFCRALYYLDSDKAEGEFIRFETSEDTERREENAKIAKSAMLAFNKENKNSEFSITAAAAFFDYDRKHLLLLFRSEKQCGTRRSTEMLKQRFGAEVEIRKAGIRDEFAALGAIGPCGRVCCCASGILPSGIQKVSLKTAKCQNHSLNPSSINGQCERVKCCFAFESQQPL